MIAALTNPRAYTDLYGDRARIPFYRSILNSIIADHAQSIVIPVALTQITAGILLLIRRLEVLALIGMIVFLVIIVPLGPEVIINLIFAAGAALVLRKHFKAPKIKEPLAGQTP